MAKRKKKKKVTKKKAPAPSVNKYNPNTGKLLKKGETVRINGTNETVTEGRVGRNSSSAPTSTQTTAVGQSGAGIIGSYKGTPITAGTDAQIRAQVAAIDEGIQRGTISPKLPRSEYPEAREKNFIPNVGLPGEMANSGLNQLTPEQLKILYPQLVPGTSAYKSALDKISTAYFDVLQQQMNAQTEQEQVAAQYNWGQLKNYIETNLNVSLSNDAVQAWEQIQGLGNQFNQQNIQGSGLQDESVDGYLRKIRQADAVKRTAAQTDKDSKRQDYYTKFATKEEIKALVDSDPQTAKNWGLIPSDEIRAAMSPSALRAKYPGISDEQIQSYIAQVLDENGNYRSSLYQKYMEGASSGISNPNISTTRDVDGNPISVDVTPSDYGKLDIDRAREQYRQEQIQLQNTKMELEKRKALGTVPQTENNQFDSPTSSGSDLQAASDAASKLGTLDQPLSFGTNTTKTTSSTQPTTTSTYNQPVTQTTTPTPTTSGGSYVIQYGDTLGALAKRYGTTVEKLAALNNISDPNKIYAGSTLKY